LRPVSIGFPFSFPFFGFRLQHLSGGMFAGSFLGFSVFSRIFTAEKKGYIFCKFSGSSKLLEN